MKKISILLMTIVMVCSMTACGSSNENKKDNKSSQIKEETVLATDITENQTAPETTKKKVKKIAQPKNISKCSSAEEAAKPVCDALMNDDTSEIIPKVPEEYVNSNKVTTFKSELSDVISSLEEMIEVGVKYSAKVTQTRTPSNATVQSINADFKSQGIKYKVTEVKDAVITVSMKLDGDTQTQEIVCLIGKIGKYWYLLGTDE